MMLGIGSKQVGEEQRPDGKRARYIDQRRELRKSLRLGR